MYRPNHRPATAAPTQRAIRFAAILLGATGALALSSCGPPPPGVGTALDDPRAVAHVATEAIHITLPPPIRSYYQTAREFDDPKLDVWVKAKIQIGNGKASDCEVHARGNNSKRFARKSFTVKLPKKRSVLPGAKMRRFFLLNLSFDPHQFETRFAANTLAELGLFPPRNKLTRVFVNGEDEGLYLTCERHENAMRKAFSDVVSVVRCNVHWYASNWMKEGVRREAIVELKKAIELKDPQARATRLRRLVDMKQLASWMTCNSLMMNADCAGELFLYERRAEGQKVGKFAIMGWDYDDLNEEPDHPDKILKHPLAWAAESDLEMAVLTTAPLTDEMAEVMQELLANQLAPTAIEKRLAELQFALNAADPDGAVARGREMEVFRLSLRARHAELLKNLAAR